MVDFDISSVSAENQLAARVLSLRAKIPLGQAEDVLAELADEDDTPELSAVAAFAQYMAGDTSSASETVDQLVESASDNPVVQVLGGTVLHAVDRSEEALALLAKHQGNLEAWVLLIISETG